MLQELADNLSHPRLLSVCTLEVPEAFAGHHAREPGAVQGSLRPPRPLSSPIRNANRPPSRRVTLGAGKQPLFSIGSTEWGKAQVNSEVPATPKPQKPRPMSARESRSTRLQTISLSRLRRPKSAWEPSSGGRRWLQAPGALGCNAGGSDCSMGLSGAERIYRRQPERRAPRDKYQDLILVQDASLGWGLQRRPQMWPTEDVG